MKIDGVSIGHRGKELAWKFLHQLTLTQLNRREVDVEEFIQNSVGPGCFEITPSYLHAKESETIVIHDSDQDEVLVYTDPRTGCQNIASHRLYEAAETIRPDRYLFEDWNNPGIVYRGTREDFERFQNEGGNPRVFHGPVSPKQTRALLNFETDSEEWVNVVEL